MKKEILIEIIAYAFILLFMYTAFSKLFIYDTYVSDLERSPFIDRFALPLSIILPAIEIVISTLLFIPATRLWGFWGALGLMLSFTAYVSFLVFTQSSLPCSCGGLIRELTWKQHFFFNVFFTGLAAFGLWTYQRTTGIDKFEIIKTSINKLNNT